VAELAVSSYPRSPAVRWAIAAGLSIVAGLLLVAGCGPIRPTTSTRPDYTLHVDNGTTLALTIVVNGQRVGVVGGQNAGAFQPAALPPLPWSVEVRSTSGRVVLSVAVGVGSVTDTVGPNDEHEHGAPGARIDLSCGRLDVYPGDVGMLGPAPGRGAPGDCLP
jgi:hypothetical protein